MNKDLDERLVPQGYYRDAQNVEIVTSEGSNAGSVQNILGNQERKIKKDGVAWSSDYISNLTNPECIGSIADTENNKIYWFIATSDKSVSAIAVYDTVKDTVAPVLVDKNSILKFSSSYLITGINIIDGLLFWTDDQYEPKKINVTENGGFVSTDFNTHTTFEGVAFKEEHITVIKQSPLKAPTLNKSATFQSGKIGIETNPLDITEDFSLSSVVLKGGDTKDISVQIFPTAWTRGSIIRIKRVEIINNRKVDLIIRATVTDIRPFAGQVNVTIRIISIDDRISAGSEAYTCFLEEDDALYKLKFPRFAYRYKYNDGEYSCFSPFSDVAFVPGLYDYRPNTGTNLGMENRLRELEITLPDIVDSAFPKGVKSVDILYKESNSNNVRIVTTLKNNENTYTLNREILKSLVESNQLTRPFDTVPKKAKAQELIGNRIVYGNYKEGYDTEDPTIIVDQASTNIIESEDFTYVVGNRKLTLSPSKFSEFPIQGQDVTVLDASGNELPFDQYPRLINKQANETFLFFTDAQPTAGTITIQYDKKNRGIPSVKSQRNYQLGVVYQDKYGRQSPVFTDKDASTFIEKKNSALKNKLVGNIESPAPDWATHYKWFLKEGASEYYNLVLSNFYTAEDGNIWLSFPSAEVNKVKAGDFIELKKKHQLEEVIENNVKLKVLDIALEPPKFVEFERVQIHSEDVDTSGPCTVGLSTFEFSGGSKDFTTLNDRLNVSTRRVVRFTDGTGSDKKVSKFYTVVGYKMLTGNRYILTLDTAIVEADNFLVTVTTPTLELFELQNRRGAELSGKFFAKVEDSKEIVENIKIPQATELDYKVLKTLPETESLAIAENQTAYVSGGTPTITWQLSRNNDRETFTSNKPYDITTHPINLSSSKKHTHPTTNSAYFGLTFYNLGANFPSADNDVPIAIQNYINNLPENYQGFKSLVTGTKIQFANEAGVTSGIYEIVFDPINGDFKDFWNKDSIGTLENYFTRIWKIKLIDTEEEPYQEEPLFVSGSAATRIYILTKEEQPITGSEVQVPSPAVFETEPAELADLDLYHEISDAIGIVKIGSTLKGTDAEVVSVDMADRKIALDRIVTGITNNETKTFVDTNGFETDIVTVGISSATENAGGKTVINVANGGHVGSDILSWFNCFTFGNGIESNRIRDDFNQVFIDKGPKVSTVLEREVVEEHKKASLIYSGIYVNKNGINETNQFLIADKITKDLNPEYGSIQKLEARDSNLISCNEDKIINIVANKDAIFNADGNPQLIASTNVLGQAVPYTGEYGISKNPESFVSYAYRSYFTDKARGVVLRLSRDGLTDISGKGMSDYFGDNLKTSTKLIGSYSEDKSEYILTLNKDTSETVAFSESSGEGGGWTSFKSYIPESGLSINDTYYTFKNGLLYSHDNETRNTFYGASAVESSINVLFNEMSDTVKSFKTLAYEGSQQKRFRYLGTIDSVEYTAADNLTLARLIELAPDTTSEFNSLSAQERQAGWYLDNITTDLQSGSIQEFIGKENKFYNHLRGDSLTDANLDASEFSVQGLGVAAAAEGDADGGNVGSQTQADVSITIAGLTNNNLEINGTPSGYSANSTNDTFTKAFTASANISTVTLQVDLDALSGFDLPSSLTISGNATASYNSTTGVVTFTLTAGGTIGTDGHTETITITSAATGTKNSVAGNYIIQASPLFVTSTDTINTTQSYSATDYVGNKQVVVSEFTLNTVPAIPGELPIFGGYKGGTYFEPTAFDLLQVNIKNDNSGKYTLTISDKITNADNEVISMKVKVEYTFGSETTITGDDIIIQVATGLSKQGPSSPKIRSIVLGRKLDDGTFVPDDSKVGYIGANDIRYFKVSGDAGALFGLTRLSPGSTLGFKLNGSASDIAQDTLQIPTEQNFLLVSLEMPDRTGQTQLENMGFFVNSTMLKSGFTEVSSGVHVQVNQHALSKLKLQVSSTSYGGTGSAVGTSNFTVTEDVDRDFINNATVTAFTGDSAIAAQFITTQAQTESEISGSSNFFSRFIPFKFVFDPGGGSDDTLIRQPEAADFTHTGNGGSGDDDNFDIDITNLTATLATGSGGSATKLTVFGMLVIKKYGDATSNSGGSFNLLNFNPDNLITRGSGVSSLYVNLFGISNIATTTSRGTIPTTINIGTSDGTNYTGTVTFVPLSSFFTGKTTSDITISYTLDGFSNNGSATNPSGWTGAYTGGLATIAVNVNLDNASGGNLVAGDAPLTIQYDAS